MSYVIWLMQHCSNTYEVLSTQVLQVLVPGIRNILPRPVTTTSTLEYCLLFIMHSENCVFLGWFQSSKILDSTAESAVFTLVEGRAAFILCHGATERRHIFVCFKIRDSGERGSRLPVVRIKLLIDLSTNTTACTGPHKSGAAWKEERIEMNTRVTDLWLLYY
jgi:hypothetical protein